jgi:hypothetical protein
MPSRRFLTLAAGHFMIIWREFVMEMSRVCKKFGGMVETSSGPAAPSTLCNLCARQFLGSAQQLL